MFLDMSKTLTVQVGSYSNWVGAHYWSALEHRKEWDPTSSSALYIETGHGKYIPRTFVVDSSESLGDMPVEIPSESVSTAEGFEVVKVETSVPTLQRSTPSYWTDIWEPSELPRHKLIVAQSEAPSESTNMYWFETRSDIDSLDDSDLRKLIEETDSGMDVVRILGSLRDGLSSYSISSAEYLANAYPKSTCLLLTSPHCQHSHAMPTVINWLGTVSALSDLDRCLLVSPLGKESTSEEALWLDSVSPWRSDMEVSGLCIESPFMSIDGKILLGGVGPRGTFSHVTRKEPLYLGKYTQVHASPSSMVIGGTIGEQCMLPLYIESQKVLSKFIRDFKAVWQPYDVEAADWEDIMEVVKNREKRLVDNLDE